MTKISAGAWRSDKTGPMQVVSGRMGKERVHFEAPKASHLAREMKSFLAWFERRDTIDAVLRADSHISGS